MDRFTDILYSHWHRYPLMESQDFGKLIYQSEFGPRHLDVPEGRMEQALREEWAALSPSSPAPVPEKIGGGFCRIYLSPNDNPDLAAPLLTRLFRMSMSPDTGSHEGLAARLDTAEQMKIPGFAAWRRSYEYRGCPAISHSHSYREAYRPHYRVVRAEYACYYSLLYRIAQLLHSGKPAVVAIDGYCGSGKTRLADLISSLFPSNLIHLDHFFLPIICRSANWQEQVGGNMDLDRFHQEITVPLNSGTLRSYQAFNCQSQSFREITLEQNLPLTVVEGCYSLHPDTGLEPDLSVFLTCSDQVREDRLRKREGAWFRSFQNIWIPMEERYHQSCSVRENASLVIDTGCYF